MAIRRQNRTIWGLAIATFVVIVTFLVRDGQLAQYLSSEDEVENSEPKNQRKRPNGNDLAASSQLQNSTVVRSEEQAQFAEVISSLSRCLELPGLELKPGMLVNIETLIQIVQPVLGPVSHQADKWMDWHLRTREGRERRIRLEIKENDLGQISRELHHFIVDRRGQPTLTELEPEKALNPSDEVISQMLKEGEVFQKERAAAVFFTNNERIEYLEKDSQLSEIIFSKNDRQFRCLNIKIPQNCVCQ